MGVKGGMILSSLSQWYVSSIISHIKSSLKNRIFTYVCILRIWIVIDNNKDMENNPIKSTDNIENSTISVQE